MQMIFVKTHVNFQFCVISGIRVFAVTFKAQFDVTLEGSFPFAQEYALCMTWSRDQLSVNTKTVHFWNILLAQAERAY